MNLMTLSIIGAAIVSLLLGFAGANYEPTGGAFGLKAEQAAQVSEAAPSDAETSGEAAAPATDSDGAGQ